MKVQAKKHYLLNIRMFIVVAAILTGAFLFNSNTANAAAKTYVSSTSKKDYVSAVIKDNKLSVKGKTTKKTKEINYILFYYGNGYSGEGPGEQYVQVKNGAYQFEIAITDRLGNIKNGEYQLRIQNGTQNTLIWITVKNKKAAFHETNAYSSDKTATSFLNLLDRKTLLTSVSDDTTASSPSNLAMSSTQKKEIKKKALEITKNASGDYNKVKTVYKWITENIYYDEVAASLTNGNGNNNPYVVLKKRYGVCEGYARLMNEMLRSLNIPCVYIGGFAQSYPVTLKTGGGHAWVAVYADKRWFYCDPTWDSTNKYRNGKKNKGTAHDSYFDQSIQSMSMTHRIGEMEAKKRVNDFDIVFYNNQVSAGMYQGNKTSITYPSKVGNLKITQLVGIDFSNRDAKKFKTNSKTKTITIPSGYTTMDNWALQYYTGLNKVMTEKSLSHIGKKIAPNSKSTVTFYGEANSAMEKYAKKDGYKFKRIPSKKNITKATVSGIKNAIYTGKAVTQSKLTVKVGSKRLAEGKEFKVSYKNNKRTGTAQVTITGIGTYRGTITKEFKINPKKPKITLLKDKSEGKVQIKFAKIVDITGYQVLYSTDKSFKSNTVKKDTKATSLTVSNLKKGKTYYVKVRAFKKDSKGKMIYGAYSSVNKIKIMK